MMPAFGPLIDKDRLTADLAEMIAIPSVNPMDSPDPSAPAEGAMSEYFEAQLRALGLQIDSAIVQDGRRNVWGRLPGTGTGPTIMLAGHLDTVGVVGYDAPFDPKIKDGKIFGRGSCDMKAGLATYLEVVRCLQRAEIQLSGDLIVAGVVDEEHAMVGSAHFGQTGPHVDYALVAEPSELAICPTHKGQVLMTLTTRGVSTHSSVPSNGVNAIYHMTAVLQAFQEYAVDLSNREPDPMCGVPTFSVGVIRGGDNACSVPDFCEIDIDRRIVPGETYEGIMAELNGVLEQVKQDIPNLDYSFSEPFLNAPPLDTAVTSPLVTALQAATQDVLGTVSPLKTFPGSTDAPNFQTEAVICGAGDLAQCHSLNEYIDIDQIAHAVEIYLRTILAMQPKP